MVEAVFYDDRGNPVVTTPKEAKRINRRMKVILQVLKELGYDITPEQYGETVTNLAKEDFKKYMDFLKRVDEKAKKEGC